MIDQTLLEPFRDDVRLRVTPTDVAQFIRLDQCQRFLRLRLTERARGDFMRPNRLSPQDPPPLMMLGGSDFESAIYGDMRASGAVIDLRERPNRGRNDGAAVLEIAQSLLAGETRTLIQPRLSGSFGRWDISGDADVMTLNRSGDGVLSALIVDIKSSQTSKVEHRLQIAFYAKLLTALLRGAGQEVDRVDLGVLYKGTADDDGAMDVALQQDDAERTFGTRLGCLERVDDPRPYLDAIDDLVTGDGSVAARILTDAFEEVPFHLTYRCDWCRYNPFCMRWAAERDDLSLIPYLTENDKQALRRTGVATTQQVSELKVWDRERGLVIGPEHADLTAKLAVTWPVGARLDELIHRARRYRKWKGDGVDSPQKLPHRGYGTLPFCDAEQNPNLVRIYVDAQHDSQRDRVYMIGSLVAAAVNGHVPPERRRIAVRCASAPVESIDDERDLLLGWIDATLRAVAELAAPDANGERKAPIHLIFFNRFDQELFLDALARHAATILTATPLFDFVTQLAAFDSPVATFLVDEIRELRNYPMLSQSLQSVATFRGFKWNQPRPFRELFRERLFDYTGKFEDGDPTAPDGSQWYTSRSRFNSQIPIEFAYAAWNALPEQVPGKDDEFAPYRAVTLDELTAFQERRLEAMEFVASDFDGNKQTTKTPFALPEIEQFEERAETLAQALSEFITIERHIELGAWKSVRLLPPERRVLAGQSLLVAYEEADQDPGISTVMRAAIGKAALREQAERAFWELNPGAARLKLSKEEQAATKWSIDNIEVRLRFVADGLDCSLQEALDLSSFTEGDYVVVYPRWAVDSRLSTDQQKEFQPTPKQMLYGMRGILTRIDVATGEDGRAKSAWARVRIRPAYGGGSNMFTFSCRKNTPFAAGKHYSIETDPNDITGSRAKFVTDGLIDGAANALYDLVAEPGTASCAWPEGASTAQRKFLDGFEALAKIGNSISFEDSKRRYIGSEGEAAILLVQGPPGTGKSFTTAYALFARLQGAMAAGIDYRIQISCHTHKAIDVLMGNVFELRERIELIRLRHPEIFAMYFDERLLDVPIFRVDPRDTVRSGVVPIRKGEDGSIVNRIAANRWCVFGATPNAVYSMVKEKGGNDLFGQQIVDCLVLDEASQLSLPVAVMAALPLKHDGRVIVVGDHRQMPPIVKHDWSTERRRTFSEFKAFESLFVTLLELEPRPPLIQFAESFRLHQEMAEFLRQGVYRHDGIAFRSSKDWRLAGIEHPDPYVAAVLSPDHPLIVVTHDERGSQLSNMFERDLVFELANALYDDRIYNSGEEASDGFGIVVPHRAQRAAFMTALLAYPDKVGRKPVIADTVERFQGDEREVIIVSATESDPSYLLASSGFLLEPRRLTVALSRAKRKLILVASRSVFELFSPDEETFANAQLWKDLLKRTCTESLWSGERNGHRVEVWGNHPS